MLDKYLVPKLFDFAKREFGYNGLISNQYHIARCAIPGDQKYRAHFDSHIFTLVIPIRIPERQDEAGTIGELVFFPNARSFPKNSFIDFIGKKKVINVCTVKNKKLVKSLKEKKEEFLGAWSIE